MAASVLIETWINLCCDRCGSHGRMLRSDLVKQTIPMWRYAYRVAVHTDAQGAVYCRPDMDSVRLLCGACHQDAPPISPTCGTT